MTTLIAIPAFIHRFIVANADSGNAEALAMNIQFDIDIAAQVISNLSPAQLRAVFERGSKAIAQPIAPGMCVTFDSEGPQSGIVTGIVSDLSNGQRIALIHVPGTQGGAPWHMPVDQLRAQFSERTPS